MEWIKDKSQISAKARVPIKSWCADLEEGALAQAKNLASHPAVEKHVALMPDAHQGYGMPIGGVIACHEAVIPNAVGVDIGCGMGAIQTNLSSNEFKDMPFTRQLLDMVKERVPVGEGHSHRAEQDWDGFTEFENALDATPSWMDARGQQLDRKNLGTLGGGNHFVELQESEEKDVWLMLHSGSRNLGHRVATYYHKLAQQLNEKWHVDLPHRDLAFLPVDSDEGQGYIRDMNYALAYALENRRRMMAHFKDAISELLPKVEFLQEINIHHNYAALETHFDKHLWVHRKGATSAKKDEMGIIPGSMGTSSYIVRGLGNTESFMSCSHGAGRKMGRMDACRRLSIEQCDKAMEGIVFDRWKRQRQKFKKKKTVKKDALFDLGEAPLAYKNIDEVIQAEIDLIQPVVKLRPLGVIKG